MGVMNLLANVQGMPIYDQLRGVSLNWIGKIILWLTTVCGSVGVGIILFSLLLKLITLPFDVVQRISMRKQNIKMKENKERMEKLQKQYANDKDKYNQKVQEMYRESGISMMSSCLPMILSLVIFIVAINAFNAFASFSNVNNYNTLVRAYNTSMMENCADFSKMTSVELDNGAEFKYDEDGNITEVIYTVDQADKYISYTVSVPVSYSIDEETGDKYPTEANFVEYIEENRESIDAFVKNNVNRSYEFKWDDFVADNSAWVDEKKTEIKNSVAEGEAPLFSRP